MGVNNLSDALIPNYNAKSRDACSFTKDLRIIGGQNARIKTYPFMASFRYIRNNVVVCGGSIISNQYILTAAHCLFTQSGDYSNIRVYTGITFMDAVSRGGHDIARVFFHPAYTGEHTIEQMIQHDIAVVKIKHAIVFNQNKNMIDLPDRDIDDEDSGYVLGWGSISHPNNTFPMQLQKAYMYIYPLRDCFEIYNLETAVGQFCAYYKENVGPCIGDSGGPLLQVQELIQFNDYQKSIDLPDRDIADDDSGVILGWGAITHPQNTYPEYLQKSFMRIFPINYCYRLYDFKMHVGQICAVNQEGVGPCMGDSGGPLVIDGKVAGVLSISLPCATGIPDIYTKVYYYLNFIRQILNP
ncbi:PREDICTED: chymotrypsin-1-like [Ceratosolen solmsi marchali]|uniref:Chymotrypsin-1-like n=1 Tax=Ceratosolen solmsi marchali TaxID=326594 RepID=A0AAJ6YUW9_9HYME|nr:PREDICTED: chymotrypsin-1-like [Ceratosolen solmsi marchali]